MAEEKGLDDKLEIHDWKPTKPTQSYLSLHALQKWISGDDFTLDGGLNPENLPAIVPKRLFLDGLLSIWHK